MRVFAGRNRPLDQTNASIVKNDVRMVWEVDAISAKTNSTTRIRGRTLRDESLETNTARDLEQVVRMFVEMDVGPVSPSSTSGYELSRSEMERWTGTPEGT